MTGEDFRYRPGVVEKAQFEYSPSGEVFNKRFDKDDKKEGLLKRLRNIENKCEKQLELIKNKEQKQLGIKSMINIFDEHLSQKIKNMLNQLNNQEKGINYKRLNFKRDKNLEFDFRGYRSLKEFLRKFITGSYQ